MFLVGFMVEKEEELVGGGVCDPASWFRKSGGSE